MAWANVSNVLTANVDSATDNPADAREDIRKAFVELQAVINGRGTVNGVASLDSSTRVPAAQLPTTFVSTSGDITFQPTTSKTKFEDIISLEPIDHASLPASPAKGDIAFLTTDSGATPQNKPVYYNGSAWYYFDDTTVS